MGLFTCFTIVLDSEQKFLKIKKKKSMYYILHILPPTLYGQNTDRSDQISNLRPSDEAIIPQDKVLGIG